MKDIGNSKIVAVTGAHTDVGKTSLARRLVSILPDSVFIKIGHGEKNPEMDNIFYHAGTTFRQIAEENPGPEFLVIESNSILKEISPECVIFLPGERTAKESSGLALKKADLVRGEKVEAEKIELLSDRLDLPVNTVLEIVEAAGAVPPEQD